MIIHPHPFFKWLFSLLLLQGCYFGVWESPTCVEFLNGEASSVRIVAEFINGRKNANVICSGQGVGFRGCDSIKSISVANEMGSRTYSKAFIDSGRMAGKTKLIKISADGLIFVKSDQVKSMWKASGKYGCTTL